MPVQRLIIIYRVAQTLNIIHSITLKLSAQYNGTDRLSMMLTTVKLSNEPMVRRKRKLRGVTPPV